MNGARGVNYQKVQAENILAAISLQTFSGSA